MTIEQIAKQALALPSEARALLADQLVESLNNGPLSDVDKVWLQIAKRRVEEVRSGDVQTIPGNEALTKVRRDLGR